MNLSLLVWLGVIGFGLSVTGSTEGNELQAEQD